MIVPFGLGNIQLEESDQNAIVAWNGDEEIIILSTNMKSSGSALVLEIIPLPSDPTKVEEGSTESFTKITEIMNRKVEEIRSKSFTRQPAAPGVEITFHKKIGAHDVTILKVNDLDSFIDWVKNFSSNQGFEYSELPSNFKTTISNYLSRNIDYFVFDVIETNETSKTINPLIYRFKTDYLYYPLEITATSDAGWSTSKVNIFIIAKGIVDKSVVVNAGLAVRNGFDYAIELTRDELREITPELEDLFKSDTFVMNVEYFGRLDILNKDLVVYKEDITVQPANYTSIITAIFVIIVLIIMIAIYKKIKK